jgi:hypothetical protein
MKQGSAGSGGARCHGRLLGGALQKAVQAGAADSQDLRGADAIAVAHFQNAADVDAADLVERQRSPIFFEGGATALRLLQSGGQVRDINEIGIGGDGGAGDDVFEFADVAGPVVLEEDDLGAAGETLKGLSVSVTVFLQEVWTRIGMSSGRSAKPGRRISMALRR